jgi:hypothetical protein
MVDWRKHSWRRRSGERLGDRIYTAFLFCTIVAILLFGSWQHGRFYGEKEGHLYMYERVQKAEKDLVKFKIFHYGKENFYVYDKDGNLCYVTDSRDIDNPKKWRKTR